MRDILCEKQGDNSEIRYSKIVSNVHFDQNGSTKPEIRKSANLRNVPNPTPPNRKPENPEIRKSEIDLQFRAGNARNPKTRKSGNPK